MIVVDTSALVAMALDEPEAAIFTEVIGQRTGIVGTPTLLELTLVLGRLRGSLGDDFVSRITKSAFIRIEPFSFAMFQSAQDAVRRYGKGRGHPAQLNFGDCFSYGMAAVLKLPLLFKGNDFSQTDIEPAFRP